MKKRGFTIVEVIVAMAILLIAFGLVTVLYTRATQVRRIIANQNEIQMVLTQMVEAVTNRDAAHTFKNLESATMIYKYSPITQWKYFLIFNNVATASVQYYMVAQGLESGVPDTLHTGTGDDTTLWYGEGTGSTPTTWYPLELNKNIYLQAGSIFEFLAADNRVLNDDAAAVDTQVTAVRLTLIGNSNDPSMKSKLPVVLQTVVRARNKMSF